MYDSTNPFAIPQDAQMVLVYVDGIYRWSQAGRDRFRNAVQVTCSAVGAVTAQVGDVELGCIWPVSRAVDWVLRARADGYDPTIYVNEMNDWGPCRSAFQARGVPEPHWWVANYNGVKAIPPGSVGRQYAHPSDPLGNPRNVPWHTAGHWDESWIVDYWPGVDTHAPGGGETERLEEMIMLAKGDGPTEFDRDAIYWIAPTARGLVKEYVASGALSEFMGKQGAHADVLPQDLLDGIINAGEQPPAPVTLTPEQLDELSERLETRLVERLAPLFELAERLKS
jgi:hypothetical protein